MPGTRWSWESIAAIGLHGLWAVLFAYLLLAQAGYDPCNWVYVHTTDPSLIAKCEISQELMGRLRRADALERVDFVGIGLTALALIVALLALFGFVFMVQMVRLAAEDEAKRQMEKLGPSSADSYMKRHGGRLVAEYLESNPWALETPSSLLESSKSDTEVSSERASAMAGMIAEGADAAAGPAQGA